jgi:predicted amidohydrolase YtcJ
LLDENPLTADPAMLKDIQVLETIKDGNTVSRMDYTLAQ